MIDPARFLEITSAKTKFDDRSRNNVLGFIDENFDPSRYPQEKPRVMIPGQPLSSKGFKCIESYTPVPGDRVMLVPVGTSDYIIVGAIDPRLENDEKQDGPVSSGLDRIIYPDQVVCRVNNHGRNQAYLGGSTLHFLDWGDNLLVDPLGCWSSTNPSYVTVPFDGLWKARFKITTPSPDGSSGRVEANIVTWVPGGTPEYYPTRSGKIRTESNQTVAVSLQAENYASWFASGTILRLGVSFNGTIVSGGRSWPNADAASFFELVYCGDTPYRIYQG